MVRPDRLNRGEWRDGVYDLDEDLHGYFSSSLGAAEQYLKSTVHDGMVNNGHQQVK
jgi:hypothetical protein